TRRTYTPQNLLDLGLTEVDAGHAALRRLVGDETYQAWRTLGGVTYPDNPLSATSRGTARGKVALRKVFETRYPGVDWTRYYDAYEMLMAAGGIEAQRAGYDA